MAHGERATPRTLAANQCDRFSEACRPRNALTTVALYSFRDNLPEQKIRSFITKRSFIKPFWETEINGILKQYAHLIRSQKGYSKTCGYFMTTLLEENDFKVLRKTLKDLIRNLSFDLLTMKFHDDCLMMLLVVFGELSNHLLASGSELNQVVELLDSASIVIRSFVHNFGKQVQTWRDNSVWLLDATRMIKLTNAECIFYDSYKIMPDSHPFYSKPIGDLFHSYSVSYVFNVTEQQANSMISASKDIVSSAISSILDARENSQPSVDVLVVREPSETRVINYANWIESSDQYLMIKRRIDQKLATQNKHDLLRSLLMHVLPDYKTPTFDRIIMVILVAIHVIGKEANEDMAAAVEKMVQPIMRHLELRSPLLKQMFTIGLKCIEKVDTYATIFNRKIDTIRLLAEPLDPTELEEDFDLKRAQAFLTFQDRLSPYLVDPYLSPLCVRSVELQPSTTASAKGTSANASAAEPPGSLNFSLQSDILPPEYIIQDESPTTTNEEQDWAVAGTKEADLAMTETNKENLAVKGAKEESSPIEKQKEEVKPPIKEIGNRDSARKDAAEAMLSVKGAGQIKSSMRVAGQIRSPMRVAGQIRSPMRVAGQIRSPVREGGDGDSARKRAETTTSSEELESIVRSSPMKRRASSSSLEQSSATKGAARSSSKQKFPEK